MLLGAADTLPRFLNYNCYVLAVFNLRPVLYSAFTRSHLSPWKNGYMAVIPYREKWLYTLQQIFHGKLATRVYSGISLLQLYLPPRKVYYIIDFPLIFIPVTIRGITSQYLRTMFFVLIDGVYNMILRGLVKVFVNKCKLM